MKSNKHMIKMITLACLLSSLSTMQIKTSFLEQIESIKKKLYKISAEELCTMLNVPFEPITVITADQLHTELSSPNDNLLVINVLPERYYHDCHIKGSISAPLPTLVERAASWDHSQKIVVYCALTECDAGEKGCILLKCMGFTDVADYKGGIKEWFQLNYPTEGPALSEYLHTKGFTFAYQEYKIFPETIVCSKQTRWIHRYKSSRNK